MAATRFTPFGVIIEFDHLEIVQIIRTMNAGSARAGAFAGLLSEIGDQQQVPYAGLEEDMSEPYDCADKIEIARREEQLRIFQEWWDTLEGGKPRINAMVQNANPERPLKYREGEEFLQLQEAKTVEEIADIVFNGYAQESHQQRSLIKNAILALGRVLRGEPPLRTINDPLPEDLSPAGRRGVYVYISRYGAKFGDGDKIKWEIGEKATLKSRHGRDPAPVTIASDFVTHSATDDLCIEVTFDNEDDTKHCVSAKMLEPVGGFPPFTP